MIRLVNTQAVLAGTQSSINGVIRTINKHLLQDDDHRALVCLCNSRHAQDQILMKKQREVAEREAKVEWLKRGVAVAEKRVQQGLSLCRCDPCDRIPKDRWLTTAVRAQIHKQQSELALRRDLLDRAEKNSAVKVEAAVERQAIIQGILYVGIHS